MTLPILSIKDLEVSFFTKRGILPALRGVSLELQRGETLGLVGESGCGKSVLSYAILRLLDSACRITGGRINYRNQNLVECSSKEMEKIRGGNISIIFQEPMTALNPVLTIGYQIQEQVAKHLRLSRKEGQEYCEDIINQVGIPSPTRILKSYVHQLSGGMRQRVLIAMAISCKPDIIIADEPTTALDVTIQAQILDLLETLQRDLNISYQFISHDLGVISEISNQIAVMYTGKICEYTSKKRLFNSPLHPYTEGLINSNPGLSSAKGRLRSIKGNVPSLSQIPLGCAFQDRCYKAQSVCSQREPVLNEIEDGHWVACLFPNED